METKVHLSNEDNTSKFLRTRLTLLYRSTLASTSPPCGAKLTQKHNLKAGQSCSRPSWASQTSLNLILISPGWSCSRTQWAKISSKAPSRHRWFKIATSVTDCTQHVNRQQTGGKENRYLAHAVPSPGTPGPPLWGTQYSSWSWSTQGWGKNCIWFSHCRFSLKTQNQNPSRSHCHENSGWKVFSRPLIKSVDRQHCPVEKAWAVSQEMKALAPGWPQESCMTMGKALPISGPRFSQSAAWGSR